jgi:tetratricopeptide (TPR) repeat protein
VRAALAFLFLASACASLRVVPDEPELPDPFVPDAPLEREIVDLGARAEAGPRRVSDTPDLDLALALERRRMPVAAFVYLDSILRSGGPAQLRAVTALVRLQKTLGDDFLIPNELNKYFDNVRWAVLPEATLTRINVMIAQIDHHRGKLDEALEFVRAVPPTSPLHARALYLEGLLLADPRNPLGAERFDQALQAFRRVLEHPAPELQEDFERVRALATLGLGRVSYGIGRYADAVRWYDRAEQIPWARAVALFEGAYARFQNDDVAGALDRLNRPEITAGFWPEAPVFEATVHYFEAQGAGLGKAERSLAKLDRLHALVAPIEPHITGPLDDNLNRLLEPDGGLPPALLAELRSNRRLMGVSRLVKQIERERAAVLAVRAWQTSPFARELAGYLDENATLLRKVASQLVKNRLTEMWKAQRGFEDNADIVRFELKTAQAQLAAKGSSHSAAAADTLKKIIPRLEDGSSQKAELLFQLAELYCDLADERASSKPQEAELYLQEAARMLATVLREYPRYERRDAVLFSAGTLAEQLHDRDSAVARYQQLLLDFPGSRLANEARKRLDVAH